MNLNLLRRQAIISSQARKRDLPYLCELEYLESTGEQWIRLNIPLGTTENIKHETSIMVMQVGTKQQEGYAVATRWYRITEDGHYTIGGANSSILASTTNYDNVVLETINQNCSLMVNDEVILTRTSGCSSSPDTYLFIANELGQNPCYIRKKYHKFYINGEIVFDGIPVLDYDMKPAMYDRVTKKFFYNEGTGEDFKFALKRGDKRAYTEVEYLESTGEQWITIPCNITNSDEIRHETAHQYTQFGKQQYEGYTTGSYWYGITGNGFYTIGGNVTSTFTASMSDFDTIVIDKTSGGETLTVNGLVVGTRNNASGSDIVLKIFDCGVPDKTAQHCLFVRKKYYKFYVNGELFFDGIPVLDYLLRPAMFDRVSGKFFYNEGTGADFKYGLRGADGNLYTSVPYIESTGGAMITLNLPVVKTQTVKHICNQQYMSTTGRQLEGFAQGGRWFGTNEGYWHITSSTKSDVMSSTDGYDQIIFNSTPTKQNLVVNNTEVCRTQTAVMQDNVGIRLFAAGGGSYPCNIRKKFHLIYVDNKLVFAGVPVVNTNGVAGLFDVVTKTTFRNAYTGQFIVGE